MGQRSGGTQRRPQRCLTRQTLPKGLTIMQTITNPRLRMRPCAPTCRTMQSSPAPDAALRQSRGSTSTCWCLRWYSRGCSPSMPFPAGRGGCCGFFSDGGLAWWRTDWPSLAVAAGHRQLGRTQSQAACKRALKLADGVAAGPNAARNCNCPNIGHKAAKVRGHLAFWSMRVRQHYRTVAGSKGLGMRALKRRAGFRFSSLRPCCLQRLPRMRTNSWSCLMPARWSADARFSHVLPSRAIGSSAAASSAPSPLARRPIRICAGIGPSTVSTSSATARASPGFRLLHRLPKRQRGERGSRMAGCFCACSRPGTSRQTTRARVLGASMTASVSVVCAVTVPTVAPWPRRQSWRCRSVLHPCSALTVYSSSRRAQAPARQCLRLHRSQQRHRCRPRWHAPNRRNRRGLNLHLCLPHGPSRCQSEPPKTYPRKMRPHPRQRWRPYLRQHRPPQSQRHPHTYRRQSQHPASP